MTTAADIRKRWGSDAEYYKENEAFHKKHRDENRANYIEYDNETGVPVKAVYLFRPFQVYWERVALMAKIAAEAEKEGE